MKIQRYIAIISLLFLMQKAATAQVYPITAHVQLNPPTTTYLTDFTILGSDRLSVNLFLNDFNEPIYDVRLKLSIEGNGISLVTHPSYVPPMITLSPGANLFSGSDLANYLSPNHMLINGITPQALQQGGSGLPEGIYTFCVQVFDYIRPEVALSLNHCTPKLLRKNYPPTLVFPACGTTIPVVAGNQDILFQWHANADLSIQTLYELSLVEVPPGMNPDDAMNGTATKILDSEPVMGTTFLYGPNQLPLEIGKKYAYRIKALDVQGNTTFENNGRSPVCTFYYGVDANGMVPLVSPLPNALASTTTQLTLSWERPSNALSSQQVYYKLKIVRLLDGQEPETALEYNPPWYEFETPVVPGNNVSKVVPASLYPMPPEERYAWEVKAYSENNGVEQEVAVSEKRVYKTLPAVEKFKAGNPDPNIISVITLTKNEDIANFQKKISGVGRMQIRENGEEVVLHFTDIVVGPFQGSLWQMEQGVITEPLNNFLVHLDNSGNPAGDPGNMDNYGRADFDATHVIVEKDDLKLRGRVKWKFPHAAAGGMPVVQSADTAIIYNRYKLVNAYVAVEGISFDLLDPYGFRITYYPSAAPGAGMTAGAAPGAHTKFALFDNILTLTLDGEMLTPVNAVDLSGNRVAYRFQDADNPYYFSQSGMGADRDIRMVKNTQIQLDALSAIFDLSEDQSPLKISTTAWKGIYFNNFNFKFTTAFDGSNQIVLPQEQSFNFEALAGNNFYAWVDAFGKNCNINKVFSESTGPYAKFNTFKGYLREIQLKLEDNTVANCFINGFVYIPVLDKDEEFTYHVPFDNNGLQVSFLDDDLVNYQTTYRASQPELRLIITVKQAVFKNNERLDLVIDLDWESIKAYIPNLTQFKIWGNGEIGFNVPGGARGITNEMGRFDNAYEITIDSVAAGFFSGTYAFNLVSSIIIGDEKVGITDVASASAPKARFYTDEERIPPSGHGPPPPPFTPNYLGASHWDNYNNDVAEELNEGTLQLFIPFIFFFPMSPKAVLQAGAMGAVVGAAAGYGATGTGTGAGVGAGIGVGAGMSAASIATGGADAKAILAGALIYIKNDPDWGRVFVGRATAVINDPIKIGFDVELIFGKKHSTRYGLIEVTYSNRPPAGKGMDWMKKKFGKGSKIKKAAPPANNVNYGANEGLPGEAQGPPDPQPPAAPAPPPPSKPKPLLGPYEVMKFGGRVYWNMSHSVEEECGANYESIIQLGGIENEVDTMEWDQIFLANITDAQKINYLSDKDLATMLCEFREEHPEEFRVLLKDLPPPDFNYLRTAVTEIPVSVWNTLEAANVNSYSHLEMLFPDDWCAHIITPVIEATKAYWTAGHHSFGDPPGWGEHLTTVAKATNIPADFGDVEHMDKEYDIPRMFRNIQSEFPAEMAFLVNNQILTQQEWNQAFAHENNGASSQVAEVTWLAVYNAFPNKPWKMIIPSLIELDWEKIWGTWVITGTADITDIVDKYSKFKRNLDKLKDAFMNDVLNQFGVSSASFLPSPAAVTSYKVDDSIDFGMALNVTLQDKVTKGRLQWIQGVLEMSGANGQLSQFLLRVDLGLVSPVENPTDNKNAFVRAKGCITYTRATKTFMADIQAIIKSGIGTKKICGQGMIHFEHAPNEVHAQIGSRDFPIVILFDCPDNSATAINNPGATVGGGVGYLGWFEFHKDPAVTEIGMGVGLAAVAFLTSKKFGVDGVCTVYGYCNAYAAAVVFADLQVEPSVEFIRAGFLLGAGVDAGVDFNGALCPFGNINLLHLYLGGEVIWEIREQKFTAEFSGEATLFGCIHGHFKFPWDYNY